MIVRSAQDHIDAGAAGGQHVLEGFGATGAGDGNNTATSLGSRQ